MKKIIILFSILLFSSLLFAQQKFEKESRITEDAVPPNAIQYLESLFSDTPKVRWYREESLEGISIEGKTKRDEGRYSIKFSTGGELRDIELTQSFEEIPEDVQEEIEDYFSDNYDRYRIKKVQIQWLGDPDVLRTLINQGDTSQRYETNYEIEFSARKDRKTKPYETLFDHTGEHIETKEIVPRNLSHLLY
ncbi:MAG: hypothetical protein ACTHZ1_03630 [Sphingobacterium sp.]